MSQTQKGEQYISVEILKKFLVTIENPETKETREFYKVGNRYFPKTQKFMKWNQHFLPVGGAYNPILLNEIAHRRKIGKSNIILVTGRAGEGKSWFGISFARLYDPNFKILDTPTPDPSEDNSQLAFEREHIVSLLGDESKLRRGKCLVIDEPQWGIDSRRWFESLQKDLVSNFEAIRFRGLMIIIVALHRSMLDKRIRDHLINYQFHMEDWGVATCYRSTMPRFVDDIRYARLGVVVLPMPGESECDISQCLRCNFLYGTNRSTRMGSNPKEKKCKVIRAIYERRKREFIGSKSEDIRRKAVDIRTREQSKRYRNEELVTLLYEKKEKLSHTSIGTIDPVSIRTVLYSEYGVEVGRLKSENIRKMLQSKYPDVKDQRSEV